MKPATRQLLQIASLALALTAARAASEQPARSPLDDGLTVQQQQLWADARQAFREARFAAAYGRFAALADSGHVPSAHLALTMLREGPALFGSDWSASEPQQRRWSVLVLNDTRQQWRVARTGTSE